MNKIIVGVLVVLTLAVGYGLFGSGMSFGKASGPAHMQHESFLQGLSAGVRDQFTVTNAGVLTTSGDATFNGGDGGVVVTSSNTATSSVTVGCIETYATSTATTVRLQLGTGNAISTTTSRNASAATTGGVVYWFYGTCP